MPDGGRPRAVHDGRGLGTGAQIVLDAPSVPRSAVDALDAEIERIDRLASRFRSDSELSQVNALSGLARRVSPEFLELVEAALWAASITGGAVDPTLGRQLIDAGYDRDFASVPAQRREPPAPPSPAAGWRTVRVDRSTSTVTVEPGTLLDFGSTAKAIAADRAASAVADASGVATLVSLGGDIAVAGPDCPEGFSVALADRWDTTPGDAAHAVTIFGGGLATSGVTARRWRAGGQEMHHILDPHTGRPAQGPWRTVTVGASSCLAANTAATAAIVKGDDAFDWLEANGLPAMLVAHDGRRRTTSGWPDAREERRASQLSQVSLEQRC